MIPFTRCDQTVFPGPWFMDDLTAIFRLPITLRSELGLRSSVNSNALRMDHGDGIVNRTD